MFHSFVFVQTRATSTHSVLDAVIHVPYVCVIGDTNELLFLKLI